MEMVERNLAVDIGEALPLASAKAYRNCGFTDDERLMLALSIVQHLKLWGWVFSNPGQWNAATPTALKPHELNASNDV
jgi:hypothetical protein